MHDKEFKLLHNITIWACHFRFSVTVIPKNFIFGLCAITIWLYILFGFVNIFQLTEMKEHSTLSKFYLFTNRCTSEVS